ncbi:MAG TPA: hypothetical protein P5211_05350, partial [Anaerolineae bacterium]|nr:hypothetical protein [Anaerolineae bacterium]
REFTPLENRLSQIRIRKIAEGEIFLSKRLAKELLIYRACHLPLLIMPHLKRRSHLSIAKHREYITRE